MVVMMVVGVLAMMMMMIHHNHDHHPSLSIIVHYCCVVTVHWCGGCCHCCHRLLFLLMVLSLRTRVCAPAYTHTRMCTYTDTAKDIQDSNWPVARAGVAAPAPAPAADVVPSLPIPLDVAPAWGKFCVSICSLLPLMSFLSFCPAKSCPPDKSDAEVSEITQQAGYVMANIGTSLKCFFQFVLPANSWVGMRWCVTVQTLASR